MTRKLVPDARPQLDDATVRGTVERLIRNDRACNGERLLQSCPVRLLGVRGYFRNSLGEKGKNDLGVYDDAIFVVTPATIGRFNANTDPGKAGMNASIGKLYAQLTPGVWPYRQGPHRGVPGHLRQPDDEDAERGQLEDVFSDDRALGEFCVRRIVADGKGERDWGHFGINIHSGSARGTSSAGCQTLPPDQWREFRDQVYAALAHHDQTWDRARIVPYVLTEERLA